MSIREKISNATMMFLYKSPTWVYSHLANSYLNPCISITPSDRKYLIALWKDHCNRKLIKCLKLSYWKTRITKANLCVSGKLQGENERRAERASWANSITDCTVPVLQFCKWHRIFAAAYLENGQDREQELAGKIEGSKHQPITKISTCIFLISEKADDCRGKRMTIVWVVARTTFQQNIEFNNVDENNNKGFYPQASWGRLFKMLGREQK